MYCCLFLLLQLLWLQPLHRSSFNIRNYFYVIKYQIEILFRIKTFKLYQNGKSNCRGVLESITIALKTKNSELKRAKMFVLFCRVFRRILKSRNLFMK